MEHFSLQGQYRVQSRRDYVPSSLEGEWYDSPHIISNPEINAALQAHSCWQGRTQVTLNAALVSKRSGKFASEPDILYKRDLFIPLADSAEMVADIVDVLKSKNNWYGRLRYLKELFPEQYSTILRCLYGGNMQANVVQDLQEIIANEYVLHEAGHFVAYDVYAKQSDSYFSVAQNKTAWPLIYLEELRADLNAFGFAMQLLPAEQAVQIFLYNVLLRLGVHRQGIVCEHRAPYGLVPYLLFCLLHDLDCISVYQSHEQHCFVFKAIETQSLLEVMHACVDHVQCELNQVEMNAITPLDRAISAAQYVRRRLDNTDLAQSYADVMNSLTCEVTTN